MATYRGRRLRVRPNLPDKSNIPLLLSPRIREGFGKAGDREMRRRRAAGDRCNDARIAARQEQDISEALR